VDVERSNQELETAMEELQSTNEELETTNEELQSSNEELETTNEELQSSNEELETTNEELQSTNEELETMNEELQQRTTELADANRFTEAVMAGMGAGVVVGSDLRIRAWNRGSEVLWGLPESEVRGLGLQDLEIGLPIAEVGDLASAAFTDGSPDDLILDARDRRGIAFRCRVSGSLLADAGDGEGQSVILVMRRESEGDQVGAG
jgi:two-component system CheB/CheR fusion protein